MSEQEQAPTSPAEQQPPTEGATPASTTVTETNPTALDSGAAEPATEGAESTTKEAEPAGAVAKESPLQSEMEAFRKTGQTAFIAGFTGECGKALVAELARRNIFSKVFLIGRREVALEGDIYKDFPMEQKVVDYDNLDASADVFKGPTVGYCCLGTTKGKAGKEGFKKVDHDYVMKVGELAKQNGCTQYHLISSGGANAKSSMLYMKVKGEVEDETAELGFEKLNIYRPGLLMCDRDEFRFGEKLMRFAMKPVDYLSPGSVTNTTDSVAQAIVARTVKPADDPKVILGGKEIFRASKEVTG